MDVIRRNYYGDGEDAYAMKRDLVAVAEKGGIEPADVTTFCAAKTAGEDEYEVVTPDDDDDDSARRVIQ